MIQIINAGLGNIKAIENIIKRVGGESITLTNPAHLDLAKKIILPGIGSFDAGTRALQETRFWDALLETKRRNTPLLGICLGMQLLLERSEEGSTDGLGFIEGTVRKFPGNGLRIPHMGWNIVNSLKPCPIFSPENTEEQRFYFVHSYYCDCNPSDIIAESIYSLKFASAIQHQNIIGVQFHPEKSHRFGKELMKRFISWEP